MKLTLEQIRWLDSRGGRTLNDVSQDQKGAFVLMGDRVGRKQKVYIPTEVCSSCGGLYSTESRYCSNTILFKEYITCDGY